MTTFYKKIDESNEIALLLTYDNFVPNITDPLMKEITEEEYNALLAEIEAANKPEEPDPNEISAEEALAIILGGAT